MYPDTPLDANVNDLKPDPSLRFLIHLPPDEATHLTTRHSRLMRGTLRAVRWNDLLGGALRSHKSIFYDESAFLERA
jgi:hypothetical protein